jgi:tetratricopeptide (TPR) repeat protein
MRPPPHFQLSGPFLLGLSLATAPLRAQAIGQGFELERQGRLADAAAVYQATLRAEPANLAALLGLERVLPGLGRLAELLPLVHHAETVDTVNLLLRGLELRVYAGLEQTDSVRAVAERWIARAPGDEAPWREWAVALEDQRQFDEARSVLLRGRRTLGRPTALAFELADLAQRSGDWPAAAAEWGALVAGSGAQTPNAVAQLEDAPDDAHEAVIRALTGPAAAPGTRRLAAELLLGWGDAARAWDVFAPTVAVASPDAALALRRFADRAAALPGPAAKHVRGLALSRYADLVPGAVAAQARAIAARALLEAGDRGAARAALEKLAADPAVPASAQALAQVTLVEILIGDGQLDSAAATLATIDSRLTGDDRQALHYALVRARLARGELDRAEQELGTADSSVEALGLRGWLALYRGDLKRAGKLFRDAGPYAGDRRNATERAAMLALLQQIDESQDRNLGAALLLLARGDSAAAVAALRRAASALPVEHGRPDVLLLAGQVSAAMPGAGTGAHDSTAAALFAEVVRTGGDGAAAPAAELAWARLLLRGGATADAVAHLEHLILTFPGSAVVPEARRELERARGAIPRL